ncbi:MAG: PIN domain-containing protein [Phycisphaerales bacterium]|nr:PIN domain-containing protein [Phycisphaerales bacterium]
MTAIFVDTSFYIAAGNPRDADHVAAIALSRRLRGPRITTEYVLVETGNWLAGAGDRPAFLHLLDRLAAGRQTTVLPASRVLFDSGAQLYRERADKEWGMTDCISFAIMEQQGMTLALTADKHFQQAGFRALLLEEQPS